MTSVTNSSDRVRIVLHQMETGKKGFDLSFTVIVVIEQGNYSLRRPPKLIIPPMFNEQSGYSTKLY